MFGFNDIWKFFFSFFLVMPLVTIFHQMGHMFFARLFGGKVNMHIGSGKIITKIGPLQIRRLYFYDGWCEYVALGEKKANCNLSLSI